MGSLRHLGKFTLLVNVGHRPPLWVAVLWLFGWHPLLGVSGRPGYVGNRKQVVALGRIAQKISAWAQAPLLVARKVLLIELKRTPIL